MDFSLAPYLVFYLLFFLFWMLAAHRQILFWLYLWQLKEYHWGRFLAHFETAKGKSIFINPLFIAKIALLAGAIGYYVWFGKTHGIPLDSPVLFTAWIPFTWASFIFLAATLTVCGFDALRAAWGIVRMDFLRPVATRKSLVLMAAAHLFIFLLVIFVFNIFLAESSQLDFALAAFILLAADVFLPLIVGGIVLALQPLTLWQKSKILKTAAQKVAGRPDLLTIGITGSYGKSVAKELLARILKEKFKVLKTEANQNTEMGVARAVINHLKPEHKIFACEIGAVHKGKIRQTAGIVKPKIGMITGINQQHLGVFGSQEKIIDGKFELMESLPETGTAILNWNSKLVADNFDRQKAKIKSRNVILAGKDIFASDIRATADSLSLDINYQNQRLGIKTNARGAFMAETILLAVSGALSAGMEFKEAVEIINRLDFTPFNLKLTSFAWVPPAQSCVGGTHAALADRVRASQGKINVIDSTYSANPDGVIAHLEYLKSWSGKKCVTMPCLIELGSESKKIHFEIGKKIGEVCDLAIITTKDRFGEIKNGAISAGMKAENIVFCDQPKKIGALLQARLSENDIILLEGRLAQNLIASIKGVE